jgi:hypothetical protein
MVRSGVLDISQASITAFSLDDANDAVTRARTEGAIRPHGDHTEQENEPGERVPQASCPADGQRGRRGTRMIRASP